MKVCNINTIDTKGGAARAAYRLHSHLNQIEDISSSYLVKKKVSTDETVKEYSKGESYLSFLKKKIHGKILKKEYEWRSKNKREDLEIFTDTRTPFIDINKQIPSDTDIINLHWIANFVDYHSFFNSCNLPIVWTLHDMNAFTGGCHYNIDCEKYMDECMACPQLGSQKQNDLSNKIWNRKKDTYKSFNHPIHIVTPSKWLKKEAEKSKLLGSFPINHIPNGVPIDVFSPVEKKVAKKALGLDSDSKTILFLADSTQNQRKGFTYLSEALQNIIARKDAVLLSVGQHKPEIQANIKHVHLEYVKNERFLTLIYSAAEIFVIPSVQDNLPNTVLEAMACGTPVIGFNIGGISDMIKDGKNGLLVDKVESDELNTAISYLLTSNEKRREMGLRSRKVVVENFSSSKQSYRYKRLYEEVLKK